MENIITNEILKNNKKSWDIVAHHFNGKDALPSYGPFTQTEEELYKARRFPTTMIIKARKPV